MYSTYSKHVLFLDSEKLIKVFGLPPFLKLALKETSSTKASGKSPNFPYSFPWGGGEGEMGKMGKMLVFGE